MSELTITRKISFEEAVDKEARHIITQMIEAELDKQNLPLPKESSLNIHIDQVLKSRPDIIEKAKQRVDARLDAHTESLRQIGVKLEIIRAIEITL
jgi:hypothetical protein